MTDASGRHRPPHVSREALTGDRKKCGKLDMTACSIRRLLAMVDVDMSTSIAPWTHPLQNGASANRASALAPAHALWNIERLFV